VSDDDLDDIAAPNCERCLTALEVVGTADSPRWGCPTCGLVLLA